MGGSPALEILLLRQQLDILERRLDKPVRLSKVEKLTVAVLAAKLKATTKQSTARLRAVIRLFQPETVLKWHRELVRRQWTHRQPNRGGRPRTSVELETLIVRFVREKPDWGYGELEGELRKLGYSLYGGETPSVAGRCFGSKRPVLTPAAWQCAML